MLSKILNHFTHIVIALRKYLYLLCVIQSEGIKNKYRDNFLFV